MRHARSLRLHVVLIASALVAVVSIAVGAVSVLSLHHYLVAQVDGSLQQASQRNQQNSGSVPPPSENGDGAGSGSSTGGSPSSGGSPGSGDASSPGGTPPSRDDFVGTPGQAPGTVTAVFQGDDLVVGGWVDAKGTRHAFTTGQRSVLRDATHDTEPTSVDLGGTLGEYRVMASVGSSGAVAVTGLPLSGVTQATVRLAVVFGVVGLAGILLAVVAAALAMGRALRPLRRVASTAAAVTSVPLDRGEVRLAQRVDPRDIATTVEVGQVGVALNDLLDHVERALAQREASESTVRRFVADASHELRTPLAAIRAYAQLSERADAPADELRGNAARIDDESVRMAALVDELLLLARLDALPEPAHEPVDVALLVAEAVAAARRAGPDHTWTLDLGDRPATVLGDVAMLRRLLDNLFANARTHTPAGTAVRAVVRVGPTTGERDAVLPASGVPAGDASPAPAGGGGPEAVRIGVADDGPGIPEELLPTVFDRFARGDVSRSRTAGSTGLGLAIARAVAEAHGGTLEARNAGGAEFTVTLPAA